MVRPTKRTPDQREALLRGLRHGASYNGAARAAGMSPSLFRQWRSEDARLAAEVADALAAAEAQGLETLFADRKREAKNETWQDAMRWLEKHCPDEWGPPERREKRRNRGR